MLGAPGTPSPWPGAGHFPEDSLGDVTPKTVRSAKAWPPGLYFLKQCKFTANLRGRYRDFYVMLLHSIISRRHQYSLQTLHLTYHIYLAFTSSAHHYGFMVLCFVDWTHVHNDMWVSLLWYDAEYFLLPIKPLCSAYSSPDPNLGNIFFPEYLLSLQKPLIKGWTFRVILYNSL